jgi:chitosanase
VKLCCTILISCAISALSTLGLASAQATPSVQQKLTLEQITSIFENSTPDFVYDYLEDIDDGAGVTAGRVGFNSSAGDLLGVVKDYLSVKPTTPKQPLSDYLSCLDSVQGTGNYKCLYPDVEPTAMTTPVFKSQGLLTVDFGLAWVTAAKDPAMRQAQDHFVEVNYFQPAMDWANQLGLQTALGDAMIYDTVIQMGILPEMTTKTQSQFAATHQGRIQPSGRIEETEWLRLYQLIRKAKLSETPVGAATTSRVDALSQVLDSGNLDLTLPLSFTYCGGDFRLEK